MRAAPDRNPPPHVETIEGDVAYLTVGDRRRTARAVIDTLAAHVLPERLARMENVLAARTPDLVLAVENLHHSHNGAACLRTAEAMGLQDLVTVESLNVFPLFDAVNGPGSGGHKVTRLTDRWLSIHRVEGAAALRAFADGRGLQIWGAAPLGEATLADVPADRPVMVLFGNEHSGIAPETLGVCDGSFRIPMYGFVESFNISVSVGIVLYDLQRRRAAARKNAEISAPAQGLPRLRREALLARWLFEDVRAAHLILNRAFADD